MAQQRRYRRTERPGETPAQPLGREEEVEQRARYGSFTAYMAIGLTLAVIVAIVAAVIFWPD